MALISAVGDLFPTLISWIRLVVNQFIYPNSYLGRLIPLFWLGVSISALFLGIKIIRSFIWGK